MKNTNRRRKLIKRNHQRVFISYRLFTNAQRKKLQQFTEMLNT
jgi:hypothetical protein